MGVTTAMGARSTAKTKRETAHPEVRPAAMMKAKYLRGMPDLKLKERWKRREMIMRPMRKQKEVKTRGGTPSLVIPALAMTLLPP